MNSPHDYKFYADDDYEYFTESMKSGFMRNHMASQAQEVCEKYLKHLIDKYIIPETKEENDAKQSALRTHNLRVLVKLLETGGIDIPKEIRSACNDVNGYYYSTRYPSEESVDITHYDLEVCQQSVEAVKAFTESVIARMESAN